MSGAGTGGTITGVGRRLESADPRTQIVLADPVGSGLTGWVETGELVARGPVLGRQATPVREPCTNTGALTVELAHRGADLLSRLLHTH